MKSTDFKASVFVSCFKMEQWSVNHRTLTGVVHSVAFKCSQICIRVTHLTFCNLFEHKDVFVFFSFLSGPLGCAVQNGNPVTRDL